MDGTPKNRPERSAAGEMRRAEDLPPLPERGGVRSTSRSTSPIQTSCGWVFDHSRAPVGEQGAEDWPPLPERGCVRSTSRSAPPIQTSCGWVFDHSRAPVPLLRLFKLALSFVFLLMVVAPTFAEIRFAPPEFENGYTLPTTQNPAARWLFMEYFDVAVLIGALGFATWIVYRKRSRNWIVGLGIFSLLYFGFYREGCVCAIGSVQNVSLGLFNNGYAVPLIVLAFFAVPLVATLFFGRTFCAAVCPHGALQDLILLRPVNVPVWLERGLGLIPFAYLGLAVLFAATGSMFIICEYDPFIPIFRLTGSTTALALAAGFLITGMFVGRPYCRFLCPYGALLRMASSVAKWRVRITPSTCTQCSLCAETCPFGVIRLPSKLAATPRVTPMTRRRLAWMLVALPLLIAAGGLAGAQFANAAARVNPNVRLHEDHLALKAGKPLPDDKAEQIALERADATAAEIEAAAASARRKFAIGGWFFGGWVGLAIAVKLLSLSAGSRRTDFEPERSGCYACARCFSSCPQELVRVGLSPVSTAK